MFLFFWNFFWGRVVLCCAVHDGFDVLILQLPAPRMTGMSYNMWLGKFLSTLLKVFLISYYCVHVCCMGTCVSEPHSVIGGLHGVGSFLPLPSGLCGKYYYLIHLPAPARFYTFKPPSTHLEKQWTLSLLWFTYKMLSIVLLSFYC